MDQQRLREQQIEEEFLKQLQQHEREELSQSLLRRFKGLVMNEKNTEEILPYQEQLVEQLKQEINEQEEVLESVRDTEDAQFLSKLYFMELERAKYLLNSYLRARLEKIQMFALYIVQDEEKKSFLSNAENEFAKQFVNLRASHFYDSFLNEFPQPFRSITEQEMVRKPKGTEFVICHVTKNVGEVRTGTDINSAVTLREGDVKALIFDHIRAFVLDGSVHLL